MKEQQKQFYDFVMERTRLDQTEKMHELLESGFERQDRGDFTAAYLAGYTPKMLEMLKPEHVDEVRSITEQFGNQRTDN